VSSVVECAFPHLKPASGYRYKCRCERCVSWHHEWRSSYVVGVRRRLERIPCSRCGWLFQPHITNQMYCSQACVSGHPRASRVVHYGECPDCGKNYTCSAVGRNPGSGFRCKPCGAAHKRELWRQKNRKRKLAAKQRDPLVGHYTLKSLAERDGCRCHLCGKAVNMSLSGLHRLGPTVDHLVPLSSGGTDDAVNVALAHRICNIKRQDHGPAQLRLIA